MSRNTKLFLMFAPLAIFFVMLAGLVDDMRHPVVGRDQCVVTATGVDAQPYKSQGPFIYRQSDNIIHDIALRCNQHGILMLNDIQLMQTPIKSGQAANLTEKKYHYLPTRWLVSVQTGKPQD
jgi:hypothetical protein